jgi:transcriptional regulator with XRE-family HTH domain
VPFSSLVAPGAALEGLREMENNNFQGSFGQYLAWARRKAGLNLRDMAALIIKEDGEPISNQYLSDIETGRRNPPADYLLERIAEVLGERVPEVTAEILYLKARRVPPYINSNISNGREAQAAFMELRDRLDAAA